MRKLLGPTTLLLALLCAAPASAITHGQYDGNKHPSVGGLIGVSDGERYVFCSGTLISPTVFLTAAHCTAALDGQKPYVTFDPDVDAQSPVIGGTAYGHPLYGSGGQNNTYDIAVIVLDRAVTNITPARLPTAGLLDRTALRSQRFIAVGYGTVREDKRRGPQPLFSDAQRRFARQGFLALTKSWLKLSMNPSTGSGGTCYGDSGGPHFLGTTDVVVSITVTGDRFCRATDVTYRLDTPWARAFLAQFVTLP